MKALSKIRVFIVDDHKLVLDMWEALLKNERRVEVVGSASNGTEAIDKIKQTLPDIVLLDIQLPDISGLQLIDYIVAVSPSIKVIAVSMHTEVDIIKRMLASGAKGYVSKMSSFEEIHTAIMQVFNGQQYLADNLKDLVISGMFKPIGSDGSFDINSLTKRELEIIGYIKQGCTSQEIAKALFISSRTVEVHRYNVFKKLNVKNSIGLIEAIRKYSILQ